VLLRQTPPNGEAHAKTLDWILSERETVWRTWKKSKCQPPIERFIAAGEDSADPAVAVADSSKKSVPLSSSTDKTVTSAMVSGRKRSAAAMVDRSQLNGGRDCKRARRHQGSLSSSSPTNKNTIASKSKFYSFKIDIRKDLPTLSRTIVKKNTPDVHDYLEEYVEALDPEAGIEAEYHPKNDKLFAWRALRLLARDHVGEFGRCTDVGAPGSGTMIRQKNGDFEGMVRSIWKDEKGIDIPGDMPKAEVMTDDEEDDKKEDKKEGMKEGEKEGMKEDKDEDMKEGTKEDAIEGSKEDKTEGTKEDKKDGTKEDKKENKKDDKKKEGEANKKEEGEEDINPKLGVVKEDDGKKGAVEMKDIVMGIPDIAHQLRTEVPLIASVSSNGESDELFPPSPTNVEYFGPQELHKSETSAEDTTAEQNDSKLNVTSTEGNIKATKQPRDPQPLPSYNTRSKQDTTESKAKPEKRGDSKPKQVVPPNKITVDKRQCAESSTRTGSESKMNSKKEDTKKEQDRKDVDIAASRPTPSSTSHAKVQGDGKKELKKEDVKQTEKKPSPTKHENTGKEKESSQRESSTQAKDSQNNTSAKKKDDNVHNRYNGGSRQNHLSRSLLEGNKRHERDLTPHGRHNPPNDVRHSPNDVRHSPNDVQSRHRDQRPQQHGRGGPPPPRRTLNGQMREPIREPLRDNRGSGYRRPNQEMKGGQNHMGNGHSRDHGGPRDRPPDFDRRGGNNRSGHGQRMPPRRDR